MNKINQRNLEVLKINNAISSIHSTKNPDGEGWIIVVNDDQVLSTYRNTVKVFFTLDKVISKILELADLNQNFKLVAIPEESTIRIKNELFSIEYEN